MATAIPSDSWLSGAGPAREHPLIRKAFASLRGGLWLVAAFSMIVNVLMLTTSVYLMQISDRVMVSHSTETLVLLTVGAVFALLILSGFDFLRKVVLTKLGVKLEAELGGPLLAASIERAGGPNGASDAQGLRDLGTLRGFMNGGVMPTLFDVPTVPVYLLVVFLIHWQLGIITTIGIVTLAFFARLNQLITKKPLEESGVAGNVALARATAQVRNADSVRSMGMIGECVAIWGEFNAKSINLQLEASNANAVVSALSKLSRLLLQIAILGWGSYLAMNGEITSGMSIACSIIGARARPRGSSHRELEERRHRARSLWPRQPPAVDQPARRPAHAAARAGGRDHRRKAGLWRRSRPQAHHQGCQLRHFPRQLGGAHRLDGRG